MRALLLMLWLLLTACSSASLTPVPNRPESPPVRSPQALPPPVLIIPINSTANLSDSEESSSPESSSIGNFEFLVSSSFSDDPDEANTLIERFRPFIENLELSESDKITVEMKACGRADAFYNTGTDTISLCPELLRMLKNRFAPEEAYEVYLFVFLHELSHALIDLLDLPILGGEEDAADAMATVLLIEQGQSALGPVLAAINFYELYRNGFTNPWAGSHSLGPQRMFNLVCWASGAVPELLENPVIRLINHEIVLANRSCPVEYKQQSDAVEQFLAPIRPESAKP